MKKSYLLAGLVLFSSIAAAEEISLDTIRVESSTIEDIATDKRTESSTVNVIDEETIEKIDPKNINDLLQTIPGITADVRSDVVEIHIRGINQQEFMGEDTGVVVVIDGIPVQQDGGKVRGINIDEIESIKVIKGSAGYLYGSDATAGAIIITTKKFKDKNGAEFSAEAGSYGFQNYRAKAYKSSEKYAFDIFAGYKYEDGYWDQTQNDQKTASGKFIYFIDDTSDLTFSADITKRYQETTRGSVTGVTQAEINPTGADDGDWAWSKDYYSDIYKYYITYNKDLEELGSLKVNTYYYKDLYNYIASPQDLDGDGDDDAYTRDSNDDIKQYGIKMEYKNSLNKLAYMLGVDLGKRESDEFDRTTTTYSRYSWWTKSYTTYYEGEISLDQSKENRYAIYGETKYRLTDKFTAILNLRYDYNKYEIETFEHDFNGTVWSDSTISDSESFKNLTYRVGTTYNFTKDHTLFSNISTGFRNPSLSQMDDNPDLDKQTYINYEIGARGDMAYKISYEVSAFITDTKNIISKVDGTYNWDSDFYDNVGDARNQGFEVSLKSDRSKKLSFSLAYTYLNAYYRSHKPFTVILDKHNETYDITGNQLPRVPHHKVDLLANYKITPKFNVMAELYAQSKYYADETNLVRMPGYEKVNVRVDYKHMKNLEFFAKVDNIFDKQYYRTVYLFSDKNDDDKLDAEDASITVDPGRVFYAGLKYRF
ncbi:TonB-dependent receptor [Hydrogenimonas thermophila]|uniref:TonB-dependent receptor n=1 Tax=Hydrogenimonas thermophila TaxID=223786 RepID=UPI002936E75A|nr:TonB-dependent receptor [Hydrogenimonas thermophila]WOE70565.1 TonB-dependent receptor [Hydrogenimonas thermophila]WOE73081.1 TonB-dependent receptor [Hydrogenimonas thermophila]